MWTDIRCLKYYIFEHGFNDILNFIQSNLLKYLICFKNNFFTPKNNILYRKIIEN